MLVFKSKMKEWLLFSTLSYIWILVDTLNGALRFYNVSNLSISSVFKVFFLGFITVSFKLFENKKIILVSLCFALCCLYHKIFYSLEREVFSWFIRCILIYAIFYFLSEKRIVNKKELWILNIALWFFIIGGINAILGVLGIGEHQYPNGVGGKGFIIAGNELGFMLVINSFIILRELIRKKFWFGYVILCIVIMLFVFACQGTKTSLFGFVIVVFILGVEFTLLKRRAINLHISLLIMTFFLIVLALGISYLEVFSRWISFIHQKGWVFFLLSGREDFWYHAYNELVKNFNFFDVLLGVGGKALTLHRIEIDILDIFVTYGLIGIVCFYGLFVKIAFNLIKHRKKSYFTKLMAISLCILISLLAGHVVNSGICALSIAIFCFYLSLEESQVREK